MRRALVLLAVQTAVLAAILGCLLVLAARHPLRLDLTPERRFTLSPHTREVLGRLTGDVRITAFYSSQQGAARREMGDLLALYAEASPRVAIALLDLDRNPGTAQDLGASDYNVAVVRAGERGEQVDQVTEEGLTAALLRVAGTPPVTAYFVLGHGEHDPRDGDSRAGAAEAARALVADGYVVRVLEGAARIPDDAGLVVLAGATRDLAPAEVDALAEWVSRGGHLLVLADPATPASIRGLVARFGIELSGDQVVDEQARLFGTDGLSARVAYLNEVLVPEAPAAKGLLPVAQSVRVIETPGTQADYLALTGDGSWADVDRRPDAEARIFRPGRDRAGPIPVAAFARVDGAAGREGRVAVVGDADFSTNLHLSLVGNRDFLLAAAGLAARSDAMMAARPAGRPAGTFSPLTLTAREGRMVFWGAVVAPAALCAAIAALLARQRRLV